ncbi:hypothetical protein SSS_01158 [Sarcoptes scabiei]|nr:hypothetical protein SSS_01158 [Sarcoptes scabiei]
MSGLLEIRLDSLSSNSKIAVMLKILRIGGNRVRVEMSHGRSRRGGRRFGYGGDRGERFGGPRRDFRRRSFSRSRSRSRSPPRRRYSSRTPSRSRSRSRSTSRNRPRTPPSRSVSRERR